MKLSLVIPAYNEENRILETLKAYYKFFNIKLKKDFEIIIVPNNCKDNTLKVTQKFAKNKKNIKIINIPYYVGKGGAVMKGFEIAEGDYVGFVDADKSTSPKNFFKLYEHKDNYEGVIASRKIKRARVIPKRSWHQDLSSFLFNRVVNLLFNLKFKDTQCGAKLFSKKTTKILTKKYIETGWIFDVDLLYLCKKNKLKILEYPIVWTDDAENSKLSYKEGIMAVLYLFKYKFKNKR